MIKIVVVILLLAMIYNLYKAMQMMLRNDPNQPSMTKFIGRRVMLSALIVLILVISMAMGWITPNPTPH
ncbi:DUF2909 domain-containing protein [Bowmanella sp. JS7-9]|uniref:DUF2909 domain-containing protein n=1 Tax=Pseudobowmanella zhangzhouensis TaxID=1537679 RepID=A0ABW1XPR6_9ALTE